MGHSICSVISPFLFSKMMQHPVKRILFFALIFLLWILLWLLLTLFVALAVIFYALAQFYKWAKRKMVLDTANKFAGVLMHGLNVLLWFSLIVGGAGFAAIVLPCWAVFFVFSYLYTQFYLVVVFHQFSK
jgi:hypothetical protein